MTVNQWVNVYYMTTYVFQSWERFWPGLPYTKDIPHPWAKLSGYKWDNLGQGSSGWHQLTEARFTDVDNVCFSRCFPLIKLSFQASSQIAVLKWVLQQEEGYPHKCELILTMQGVAPAPSICSTWLLLTLARQPQPRGEKSAEGEGPLTM